ncbi:MAG TPA: hypothetical protein VMH85_03495 [Terriglobales bacterium]|nr:hypothetical protein [Terriglobales bacterium]
MSNLSLQLEPEAERRDARLIHALYSGLARDFVLEVPAYTELESTESTPSQASLDAFREWFAKADEQVQVHQLRQFLQNSPLVTNDGLQALLRSHLRRPQPGPAERDKIEFLLVQFFSSCAPARLEDEKVTLEYVAEVLQPVLGTVDLTIPEWLQPLEELIRTAKDAPSMNQLLASGILEKGRKIKSAEGQDASLPVVLVALTRFNFLLRRTFFRLMHDDLNTILDGLRQLEQHGATTLDCRRAQFSADEPIVRLRMICQSWKVMFQAEYSTGQPLRMLVDVRAAVDQALEQATAPKAMAAAAAASGPGETPQPAEESPAATAIQPEPPDNSPRRKRRRK